MRAAKDADGIDVRGRADGPPLQYLARAGLRGAPAAPHNKCLKITLELRGASRESRKKEAGKRFAGTTDMLDAIQVSLALWAMIVCGGIKLGQVLHYLL